MKLLTGLFRLARKRVQTTDTDMGAFRDKITELVEKKDSLSDDEINGKVEELKAMSADLPESDDKGKLDRFLEDFKSVKEQDKAAANEAAKMVADLFEKLDTEAMKDVPETAVKETETPPAEQKDGETQKAETQTKDADGGETAEQAPEKNNAQYTLEEIYQFIKKRLAEDSGEKTEEKKKEEEETETVTDHAPHIPVTMNGGVPGEGSIGAMFARIKQGGR
ncbi:hypothetical protein [uncultured Treponema sp.]|uniref:hypothetical protein n=1 Tax=uncultured Treponema sp. TaxID=162155 RepID=UPI0027D9CBF9|nr:hypothetical protein [uncultured Treponema sp.]